MNITRREFIKRMMMLGMSTAAAGAMFSWLSCRSPEIPIETPPSELPDITPLPPSESPPASTPNVYLAVARGEKPSALTEAVIKTLGGMERFVKPGDDVIIKPNICVGHRSYEYAATTNPEVVGTLIRLCKAAGAKRIRAMDYPFAGLPEQGYSRSGIAEAVQANGGEMEIMSRMKFRETKIPHGADIKSWSIYGDILDADVVINVPIAKHHGTARLSLGMKNLMGTIQNANQFHSNLGQRIADLSSVVRPELTVVDAVRILLRNGPTGGNLDDVKIANTVIASSDMVAADAYAATLFGLTGKDISYIVAAEKIGLGTSDLKSISIKEINV